MTPPGIETATCLFVPQPIASPRDRYLLYEYIFFADIRHLLLHCVLFYCLLGNFHSCLSWTPGRSYTLNRGPHFLLYVSGSF